MLAITREDLEKLEEVMYLNDLRTIDELCECLKNIQVVYAEKDHRIGYLELRNSSPAVWLEPKDGYVINTEDSKISPDKVIIYIEKKDKRE